MVPWYSASRGLGQLVYAATAVAVLVVPATSLVPVVLVLWAVVTIPSTDRGGRVQRGHGRRRRTARTATTCSAGAGRSWASPPRSPWRSPARCSTASASRSNYQIAFLVFSAAGLLASWFSSHIKMPDHPPAVRDARPSRCASGCAPTSRLLARLAGRSSVRRPAVVITFGLRFAAPLIPLWYIREADAPDAWIGIIGTAQSLALLVGYYAGGGCARRYSTAATAGGRDDRRRRSTRRCSSSARTSS